MLMMVHPSELLRTNSNEGREFAAPRYNLSRNIDCGLSCCPALYHCNLERLAKPKVFLIFLSLVGFLQGVVLTYFRETSNLWRQHYNISQDNVEWLIYTDEFFIGIFALVVSYWGNRIHRITWIGGLTMYQAIASAVLVVPEIYRHIPKNQTKITDLNLCSEESPPPSPNLEIDYIALAILAIYQVFYAMASISFISHGLTYIDDNTSPNTSPGHIGIALACMELGKQAGLYLSWIPAYLLKKEDVFVCPVWLCVVCLVFISGILISMFPRSMPSVLMKTMAASIVDLASGHEVVSREQKIDGFFKTLFRLLKNKILMVNILCVTFLQAGLINFNIFEKYFNQSRFQVSYVTDSSYTQLTTTILKQPLVATSLIAIGMVIAKARPHLKSLVKWNIAVLILVIIFFGSTAFLRCVPKTTYERMLSVQYCSQGCHCSNEEFQPVCVVKANVEPKTYYSPCKAGCTSVKEYNFGKTYNCACGNVTEGPCEAKKCDLFYSLSQINRVITTALLASTLVTNLIINMRCIKSKDKAMALGLEATFASLIPYVPVKLVYGAVSEQFCIHRRDNVCRLFSENFGVFLSIGTIGFMLVSLILAIVVLILLKFRPNDDRWEEESDNQPVEMEQVNNVPTEENRLMSEDGKDEVDLRVQNQKQGSAKSTETISDSLLEMENVGDDHDSIDSSSHLDEVPERLKHSRIIESSF